MVTHLCFRNEIWFDDVDEILLEDVTKSKDPLLKKNAVTQWVDFVSSEWIILLNIHGGEMAY